MADDSLFIDDGFTRNHYIPAAKGLHPAVAVSFRPALARERAAYSARVAGRDPESIAKFEDDLILRYIVTLNDEDRHMWKDKISRLHPTVRAILVDLILSYTPAQEQADLGN